MSNLSREPGSNGRHGPAPDVETVCERSARSRRRRKPRTLSERVARIKNNAQQQCAKHWLSRHRETSDPRALEQLAVQWAIAARRSGNSANARLFFTVFDALANLPADRVPRASVVSFVLRSLQRFDQTPPLERFLALVRAPNRLTAERWKVEHEQFRADEDARSRAAVRFSDMAKELSQLVEYFFGDTEPLPLGVDDKLEGYTAYTDGRMICLPAVADLVPDRMMCEWLYVHLMLHEITHCCSGTFSFRFSSPKGREIWDRLARRRFVFRQNRSQWDARARIRQLVTSGEEIMSEYRPKLPHLIAFTMHFAHFSPEAVEQLFNLVEDIRIERLLARQCPVMQKIVPILTRYEELQTADPRYYSLADNFQLAMLMLAKGMEVPVHIGAAYQAAWERVREILDRCRESAIGTVDDSVAATLDLVEALEQALPSSAVQELQHSLRLARAKRASLEDVLMRLEHRRWYAERDDHTGRRERVVYHAQMELAPTEPGPYSKYPEVDAWIDQRRIVPEAVWLRESPWRATRQPYPMNRAPSHYVPIQVPQAGRSGVDRRFVSDGVDVDMGRAYDMMVARQTGRPFDDRVFRQSWLDRSPSWTVSIVIDLSISMEYRRSGERDTAIVRAIETTDMLARWLDRSSIPVAVYGAIDGGRRPVDLMVVKDYDEPHNSQRIRSLHAQRTGGFRYGAVFRHLGARLPKARPHARHLVMVMTDWSAHYLYPGYDYLLGKLRLRCRDCQSRVRCPIEPLVPQTEMRGSPTRPKKDELNIFLPPFYEFADVRHALQTTPQIEPLFVALQSGYSKRTLDETFGPDRSHALLSMADEPKLVQRIRELMTNTALHPGSPRWGHD